MWKRSELSIRASRGVLKGHGTIWVALVSTSIAQGIRSFMQNKNKDLYGNEAFEVRPLGESHQTWMFLTLL